MAAIAAAISAGAGLLQSGLGLFGASKSKKRTKKAIKRAYERADRNLVRDQGDIRQGTSESLVARGLLNTGEIRPVEGLAETDARRLAAADGVSPEAAESGFTSYGRRVRDRAATNARANRFRTESARGEVGQRNTLGGAISGDLSTEFLQERQDLFEGREDALKTADANYLANAVGAITGGLQTGLNVYGAMTANQQPQGGVFTEAPPAVTDAVGTGVAEGVGASLSPGGLPGAFGIPPVVTPEFLDSLFPPGGAPNSEFQLDVPVDVPADAAPAAPFLPAAPVSPARGAVPLSLLDGYLPGGPLGGVYLLPEGR